MVSTEGVKSVGFPSKTKEKTAKKFAREGKVWKYQYKIYWIPSYFVHGRRFENSIHAVFMHW